MTDVARLAGVSHQTVSRVLNDHPNVRPETRRRVRAAIAELGYRPNTAARALVTGRSQALGVVTLNIDAVRAGVDARRGRARPPRAAGFLVNVDSVATLDRALDRRARSSGCSTSGVAGIVVIAPVDSADEALDDLARRHAAGDRRRRPRAADRAGRRSTRRPAPGWPPSTCSTPGTRPSGTSPGPTTGSTARGRIAGWRAALREAGAEEPPLLLRRTGRRAPATATGQMLARMPEVTAVFAANDQMALGLLRALDERGRRVPEDVSVVGFDDLPEAAYFIPPLTTVRQDFDEVGPARHRTCCWTSWPASDAPPRGAQDPAALVVRASVAAPASCRRPGERHDGEAGARNVS